MKKIRLLTTVALGLICLVACVPEEVTLLLDVENLVEERIADPQKKADALKVAVADVKANSAINASYNICPAKEFGKQRQWLDKLLTIVVGGAEYDTELCSLVPELCRLECKNTEPTACFHLARAFESSEDVDVMTVSQRVYAYGCVVGSAESCTNRGAHIRNSLLDTDPASHWSEPERAACQFGLFKVGCDNNYSWGCAMVGQAYLFGEGVAKDKTLAAEHLKKACSTPETESCSMANNLAETHDLGAFE